MDRQRLILILLFLTVLASGCIDNGTQESSRSITVHSLSVSPQQIYEGTSVTVSLDLANTGNVPAEVRLGDNGQRIMKDYCADIFSIDGDVSVTTSGERNGETVNLESGDELRLRWNLQQEGEVPLHGHRCNIKFQVPFKYRVEAYKQVQIKSSREVENSKLNTESSSGPLLFALETIGSSTDNPSVFVAGEDDSMTLLMQLQNTGQEDYSKGVVDIDEESLSVRATNPLELDEGFSDWSGESGSKCDSSGDEIRMFEGESRIIKCDLSVPESLDSPSVVSEIFAEVEYSYLKDIGSRQVEVQTRGN